MKIVVTYEAGDIARLIRQDLQRQGIMAKDTDIKYVKGAAVVSVEVEATFEESALPPEASAPAAPVASPKAAKPAVSVVEGGAATVDMSAVLAESRRVASIGGRFPAPRQEHSMLDGESYDPPNWEKP